MSYLSFFQVEKSFDSWDPMNFHKDTCYQYKVCIPTQHLPSSGMLFIILKHKLNTGWVLIYNFDGGNKQ